MFFCAARCAVCGYQNSGATCLLLILMESAVTKEDVGYAAAVSRMSHKLLAKNSILMPALAHRLSVENKL
jgi:hypothetical protein